MFPPDALAAMDTLGISPSPRERVFSAWVTMTLAENHGLDFQRRTLYAHFLKRVVYRPPLLSGLAGGGATTLQGVNTLSVCSLIVNAALWLSYYISAKGRLLA